MPRLDKYKKFWGGKGDDVFVGSVGQDQLHGRAGHDVLVAGEGKDRLYGGGGNDYLSGNQGNDWLLGGRGADTFVFDGDFDRDVISDFKADQGDSLEFWFYEADRADWDVDTILGFAVETAGRHGGTDVKIRIPDSDECVIMRKVSLDDLSADNIEVKFYSDEVGLA